MKLIPWKAHIDPFEDYESFIQPYRSMMPTADGGIVPPVDIYEDEKHLVVETPLAGIDPKQVEISVEGDVLTIRGSMQRKTEIEEKNYYRKEVRSGSVFRQIPLPMHVIGEKANAEYERGVLKIQLPKAAGERKKTIKIDVKKTK